MTNTSSSKIIDRSFFQQWLVNSLKPEKVRSELIAKGLDTDTIEANLQEYKRLLNTKRNFNGFIYLGLGAFIGFISCVLAVINPLPEWHNFFLFGLTSIAVLIVFIGLYMIFEN